MSQLGDLGHKIVMALIYSWWFFFGGGEGLLPVLVINKYSVKKAVNMNIKTS